MFSQKLFFETSLLLYGLCGIHDLSTSPNLCLLYLSFFYGPAQDGGPEARGPGGGRGDQSGRVHHPAHALRPGGEAQARGQEKMSPIRFNENFECKIEP